MGRTLAGDMLDRFEAQRGEIDTCEERFSSANEDRSNRQVQVVDQPGAQKLPNRRDPAAQPNIAIARGLLGLLQRSLDAVGHEAKLGTARHTQRAARMMGQHEDGSVIRRLLAPPAPPAFIRPGTPDWFKHVASEKPNSEPSQILLGNLVINADVAAFMTVYVLPGS